MNARGIFLPLTVIFLLTFTSLPLTGLKSLYAEDPPPEPPVRCAVIFPLFSQYENWDTRFSIAGDSTSLGDENPQVELFYYNDSGEMIPVEISTQWSEKTGKSENSQWIWWLSDHEGAPSPGFLVVLTNIPYVEAACFIGDLGTGAVSDAPAIIDYSITGIDESGHIIRNAACTPPEGWEDLDPAQGQIDPTLHHTTLVFPHVLYVPGEENDFDTGISITNTFDATGVEGRNITFYFYDSAGSLLGTPVTEQLGGDGVSEMSTRWLGELLSAMGVQQFSGAGCLIAQVNIPFAQGYSFLKYDAALFHAGAGAKVDNDIYTFTNGVPQRLIEPEGDHTSIVVPFVTNVIEENPNRYFWTGVSVVNTVPVGDSVAADFYLYDMSGNFVTNWTSTMASGDELNGMLLVYFFGSSVQVNGTGVYSSLPPNFSGWLLIKVHSPGAEAMLFVGDAEFDALSMTRVTVDNDIIGVSEEEGHVGEIIRVNPPAADAGDSWPIPFVATAPGQPPWDTCAITVNTRNRSEWQGTNATFKYQGWTEAGTGLDSWTDTASGSGALFPARQQLVSQIPRSGYYPLTGRLRVETNTSCTHGLAYYLGTDGVAKQGPKPAAEIKSLEVKDGATAIADGPSTPPDTDVCAAIKGDGYVILQAKISEGVAVTDVEWSCNVENVVEKVDGQPLQRKVPKKDWYKYIITVKIKGTTSQKVMWVYIIWAEPTGFKATQVEPTHYDDNSKGFPKPPTTGTGLFGPDPNTGEYASRCEIQFTVRPNELVADGNDQLFSAAQIKWDVSRDKRQKAWKEAGGNWSIEVKDSADWVSDDPVDTDEDNNPWGQGGNGHIYGNKELLETGQGDAWVDKYIMREWVRVNLSGGLGRNGTKCSDYSDWHCFRNIKKVAGNWEEDNNSFDGNKIEAGNSTWWGNVPQNAENVKITTASPLPKFKVGVNYNQTLAANGGSLPYKWTIDRGQLPPGLALNENGTISGTPTQTDKTYYIFTVECEDSPAPPTKHDADLKTFTINIDE